MAATAQGTESERFNIHLDQQPTYAQVRAARALLEIEAESPQRDARQLAVLRAIAEAEPVEPQID